MWNSAKLASGTKAPIRIMRPSWRKAARKLDGFRWRVSNASVYSGVTTMRRRANSATTLIAKATKKG